MERILDAFNTVLQSRQVLSDDQLQKIQDFQTLLYRQNNDSALNRNELLESLSEISKFLRADTSMLTKAIEEFSGHDGYIGGLPDPGAPRWVKDVLDGLTEAVRGLYDEIYRARDVVHQLARVQGLQKVRQDFLVLREMVETLTERLDEQLGDI